MQERIYTYIPAEQNFMYKVICHPKKVLSAWLMHANSLADVLDNIQYGSLLHRVPKTWWQKPTNEAREWMKTPYFINNWAIVTGIVQLYPLYEAPSYEPRYQLIESWPIVAHYINTWPDVHCMPQKNYVPISQCRPRAMHAWKGKLGSYVGA